MSEIIRVLDEKTYNKVIRYAQTKYGKDWIRHQRIFWKHLVDKKEACLRIYADGMGYDSYQYYKSNGHKILTIDELIPKVKKDIDYSKLPRRIKLRK